MPVDFPTFTSALDDDARGARHPGGSPSFPFGHR